MLFRSAWVPNRGEKKSTVTSEPRQEGERRFVVEDEHATAPGLAVIFNNLPERRSDGYYALTLLGQLLFEGKSARLYQALVKEAQLATAIDEPFTGGLGFPTSGWETYKAPGLFGGFFLKKEGADSDAIRGIVLAEIGKIAQEGVDRKELERVRTKFRSDWIRARQTTRGRAAALLRAEILDGDAALANGELEKFLSVAREDLKNAAGKYLIPAALNIFELRPKKEAIK